MSRYHPESKQKNKHSVRHGLKLQVFNYNSLPQTILLH